MFTIEVLFIKYYTIYKKNNIKILVILIINILYLLNTSLYL